MRAYQKRGHIHHSETVFGRSVKRADLEVYLPTQKTELFIFAGIHGEEPETRALIKLIADLQPKHIVSMHGPLACIDDPLASPLAQWMARETDLPLVPDIGDPTPGSFGSWCADEDLPVITYELPAESLWSMQEKNLGVLRSLLLGNTFLAK